MVVLIAVVSALLILFGLLALPYNVLLAIVGWGLGGASLLLGYLRLPTSRVPLLVALVVCLVIGVVGWTVGLMPWANREVVSDITVLNAEGTRGRVLVVYHPGRSDLQTRAVTGFAEGLVAAGWRVEMTTASTQTPTDLSSYGLLVLGAQSYTWAPARPVQSYVQRAGPLHGLPVIAILSGLGETGPANRVMERLIREEGGTLVGIYNVWQMRPIDEVYGTNDPAAAMRGVAESLDLP